MMSGGVTLSSNAAWRVRESKRRSGDEEKNETSEVQRGGVGVGVGMEIEGGDEEGPVAEEGEM